MKTLQSFGRRQSLLLVLAFAVGCASLFIVVGLAAAQKTKKATPAQITQNMLKDVLVQYQGQTTNLGVLKKIAGDYFVVEEETATALYPLTAIQSFRILKPEEDVTVLLEIRLVAKD